ncbi:MAG: S41 family peptidase [Coriobacteriia bacterium]|nr:S41 family peptidase [Coriobacteriia bacterium]MCL2870098.1 S41 family peptidase [Coriobacteriia bacterium]
MNRTTRIVALTLGAMVLALSAFVGGFAVSQIVFVVDSARTAQNAQLTSEVSDLFNLMQREALDPPSETTATVGALNGLLRSNDDHYARFLPEEELQRYEESMAGAFGGIGVLLGEDEGTTFVVQVYEDTPAEHAGIQEGDFFYGVDGETRNDWTISELSSRVRGEVGTDVEIIMVRPWDEDTMPTNMDHHLGDPFTVSVTRDIIQAPVTEVKTFDDNVGYVRLFDFNLRATEELYADIEGLIEEGAESLILDLRSNPGGDLNQAISVASLFIESGPIVQIEEAGQPEPVVLSVRGDQISQQLPLVVLVNGNSASASEIVAAAIQDHDRGTVVGVETFGKGSVQTQIPFRNGAAFMTTAQYLSAHGRVIEGEGVAPDVEAEMSIADAAEEETDTQLHAAIEEASAKQR